MPPYRLGIDIGGTFTDFSLLDEATGEHIAASINVWTHVNDLFSRGLIDTLRYIGGELNTEDITDGKYVSQWIEAAKQSNGVGWYYNGNYSWGFAPEGDTINRNQCDVVDSSFGVGIDGDKRLCWHTLNNALNSGWRCGRADSLNSSSAYERVIFGRP